MLLQAALGLRIDCYRKQVQLLHSALPIGIESLTISDLQIGDERLQLEFRRVDGRVVATAGTPPGSNIEVRVEP